MLAAAQVAGTNVKTLVLNADMQPLSWAPLSLWCWKEAITAVMQDRVIQLRTYENLLVRSPSQAFEVPSIVALKDYHKRKRVAFTRYNVFLRDGYRCQYCGEIFPAEELTFDHVVPRSKNGASTWQNIVSACHSCNLRKGSRAPREAGLRLLREPREPSPYEIDQAARDRAPREKLHETWLDFLYWDSEIQP